MGDLTGTTDLCRLMGDVTRVRLLSLLATEELTVAELVEVTGLAQSRVSTHLGQLREAGLLRNRRAGSSTFYALNPSMPADAQRLWALIGDSVRDSLLDQDRERAAEVVAAREGASWADQVAGQMSRHWSPGRTWESAARAVVGLARLGRVVDIASGDGAIAELLAPRAAAVTCVDISPRVVAVGRERLGHVPNLSFVEGDMHDLPLADGSFDAALLMNSLCFSAFPERALAEAARVLVAGGLLIGVTLRAHSHAVAVEPYDHLQMGFEPDDLRSRLATAGFQVTHCAATIRERRPPHFEVVTFHATRS